MNLSMTQRISIPLTLATVMLFTLACTKEPDCDNERPHDQFVVGFYKQDTEKLERDTLGIVGIEALGSEFSFLDEDDTLGLDGYELWLNADSTQVTYIFVSALDDDTLIVSYNKELEWLSEECGPMHRFDDLEIIYHTFDSARVVQRTVNASVNENIRVFN